MNSKIQSDTRLKWIEDQGQKMKDYAYSVESQLHHLRLLANQLMDEVDELQAKLKKGVK